MRTFITLSFLTAFAAFSGAQMIQISEGHIDLGLAYDPTAPLAERWEPHIHAEDLNDEFGTDEAYLYYGTAARANRSASSAYDFTGATAGQQIWRNYTNNVANIPWLGFGFEEIAAGTFGSYLQTDDRRDPIVGEWIDLQLTGYTAPAGGNVSFFQGSSSAPLVWFATADGLDASDKFISTVGGHEHGSFLFTAAGVYTLTFEASAIDKATGGRIASAPYTYTFGVEAQPVPEPTTMAALGLGALGLLKRRRKA